MTTWGYSRSSTADQDGMGGTSALKATIPDDRVFLDRGVSGLKPALDRPEFSRLYGMLAPGDVLTVPDLSRLGRDVIDVLTVARELDTRGIGLVVLSVGGAQIDTRTALGKFFLQIMAAIAELVRNQIADSTKLKLAALKAQGVYPEGHKRAGEPVILGAPKKLTAEKLAAARQMRKAGMSVADIAPIVGISVGGLYRNLGAAETAASA
jgi:putative DNA-invertase from lambdoid prophage Rac